MQQKSERMKNIKIQKYIEQTVLKAQTVDADIENIVKEAKEFGFVGVCVPPFWVKKAKREIGDADIQFAVCFFNREL